MTLSCFGLKHLPSGPEGRTPTPWWLALVDVPALVAAIRAGEQHRLDSVDKWIDYKSRGDIYAAYCADEDCPAFTYEADCHTDAYQAVIDLHNDHRIALVKAALTGVMDTSPVGRVNRGE